MIPGVRSFVSIPAGQRRMPWYEFALLTALGSLVWNSAFVYGGYALGTRWDRVQGYAGVFQIVCERTGPWAHRGRHSWPATRVRHE